MRRFLPLALFFILPLSAWAASVISQQTDYSTSLGTGAFTVNLGTGLTGSPRSVEIYLQNTSGSDKNTVAQVDCYTTSSYTSYCSDAPYFGTSAAYQAAPVPVPAGSSGIISVAFGTTTSQLNPTDYYQLFVYPLSSGASIRYGNSGGTPYYVLDSNDTRIVSLVNPVNGATSSGTSVIFDFTYFYNDSASSTPYDVAGFNLQDNTASQTINTPTAPIEQSGGGEFQGSLTLVNGDSYTWTPYLFDTASYARLDGPSATFTVGTPSSSITGLPFGYQGLWDAIQNNPPFAFIFQLRTDLSALSPTTTPAAVTLNIPDYERTNIIGPLDTGIASLLALFFAVWAFKRFQHFEF